MYGEYIKSYYSCRDYQKHFISLIFAIKTNSDLMKSKYMP